MGKNVPVVDRVMNIVFMIAVVYYVFHLLSTLVEKAKIVAIGPPVIKVDVHLGEDEAERLFGDSDCCAGD